MEYTGRKVEGMKAFTNNTTLIFIEEFIEVCYHQNILVEFKTPGFILKMCFMEKLTFYTASIK